MRHREQSRQARRIIKTMIAMLVDPRSNPAETKSIETKIFWHVMRPSFSIFTRASLDIRKLQAYFTRPREHFRSRQTP
jgi:hypothetical protein